MKAAELRKMALDSARFCRSPEREGECQYLQPGSGATYEDCPMRPVPCGKVTGRMWARELRELCEMYDEIETVAGGGINNE